MALAGLNRPMGSTITKMARKVGQTTLPALRAVRNCSVFLLKSLLCAFNLSQNAPLKL